MIKLVQGDCLIKLKEEILKEFEEMVIIVSRIPSTEKVFALDIKTSTPLKNWLSSKLDEIEKEVMGLLPDEKEEIIEEDGQRQSTYFDEGYNSAIQTIREKLTNLWK